MSEIKVERRDIPKSERIVPWGLFFGFVVGLAVVGVLGYLGYSQIKRDNEQSRQANEQALKKLNITIGDFDEKQLLKLTPILQNYTADFCDPRSKVALLRQIDAAGFVRLAAKMASDHYEKCAKYSEFLELGYYYNKKLGQYSRALEIINQLIELDPASADYRFSRAKTYETMKFFDKALLDQISALELLGRQEKIDAQQFYEVARIYAALEKFCEAATSLETYISYDFVKRRDPQIDRLINEYRQKGNCKLSANRDNAFVPFKRSGAVILVEAKLNNVAGIFVVDTGASLVSVTNSFANKAGVSVNAEDKITLQTANGVANGLLATAKSIQVGNAYSQSVPIVVVSDAKLGTDDGVIGLLGMSFLSRFAVKIGKDSVELRSRF